MATSREGIFAVAARSHRFRRLLGEELKAWRAEGLVDDKQAAALTQRYELDRLGTEANQALFGTIFLIGAVLIGCGVIAFVAAHWNDMDRALKVVALLAAMLAAHGGGYYLWRVRKPAREHLGHALTVLGTLIFGANIGLFAQIFHISDRFYNGFRAWALGALLIALALGSVANAFVALAASVVWFGWYAGENAAAMAAYPVLVAAVFLPMAYRWRSHVLFVPSILAIVGSLITNAALGSREGTPINGLIAVTLPFAALWCFGALHGPDSEWKGFGAVARSLGAVGLAGTAFVLSFHDLAEGLTRKGIDLLLTPAFTTAIGMSVAVIILAMVCAAIRSRAMLAGVVVRILTLSAVILAGVCLEGKVLPAVGFNVIAAGFAAFGIVAGLRSYERRPYWGGLTLAVLLIVSRFFEYESHLLIKSAAFIAAGIALIAAGVAFENRMRSRPKEE